MNTFPQTKRHYEAFIMIVSKTDIEAYITFIEKALGYLNNFIGQV